MLTELAAVHGAEGITYASKQETSLVPGRVGDLRFEREHELLIEYREARVET